MKVLFAYLLSIISMPIVATIIGLCFVPLLQYLKRYDEELLYWIDCIISSMFSYLCVVFTAQMIFSWLDVKFSFISILFLFSILSAHNVGRIIHLRRTNRFMMEISYTVGGTLGFIVGTLYLIYSLDISIILLILIVPIIFLVLLLKITKQESFPFWKLAADMPDEAYEWFSEESCWVIYDPEDGKNTRPDPLEYCGPYKLSIPCLNGRIIYIYARKDGTEESQRRFLAKYTKIKQQD